mgnify:CR=1 FL=1
MLRKPRFNLSQPSFSTSMFLKNSGRTREREWIHVCIQNTGLVNYSSNVLTKQRRTRELFNEAHHNIRLYFRRTSGPCCQWGMFSLFERAKPKMSFCIKKSMRLQNFSFFPILLDVPTRADFSWNHCFFINVILFTAPKLHAHYFYFSKKSHVVMTLLYRHFEFLMFF